MSSRAGLVVLTLLLGPTLLRPTAVFAQDPARDSTPAPPASSAKAQPQPDASGLHRYTLGGKVTAPVVTFSVEPTFSNKARRKKLGGICNVSLIVDAQGNPQNVHVTKSVADGLPNDKRAAAISLDEKAVEAVKKYRLKPATLDGKPVPVEITVEVRFRIY